MARKSFKIPEVLTESEQEALLAQPNPRYPTGQRNYALIRLMLDTGLRLSEAIHLQWNDIDVTSGKVHVKQGKGAKDRILWIGELTLAILQAWQDRQATACKPCGSCECCFTTLKGKPLAPQYIQQLVERLARKAGIEKHVHPHMLRHSFATDLYRETSKIRLVQKALGHSDLSTTMIYTHIFDEELEGALKSFRQQTAVAG